MSATQPAALPSLDASEHHGSANATQQKKLFHNPDTNKPLKFWVSLLCPQRADTIRKIREHGGDLYPSVREPGVIAIGDPMRDPSARCRAEFIDDSIAAGHLVDRLAYTPSLVRTTPVKTRTAYGTNAGARTEFTKEDDMLLLHTIRSMNSPRENMKGLCGKLAEEHPHHSIDSWYTRLIKKFRPTFQEAQQNLRARQHDALTRTASRQKETNELVARSTFTTADHLCLKQALAGEFESNGDKRFNDAAFYAEVSNARPEHSAQEYLQVAKAQGYYGIGRAATPAREQQSNAAPATPSGQPSHPVQEKSVSSGPILAERESRNAGATISSPAQPSLPNSPTPRQLQTPLPHLLHASTSDKLLQQQELPPAQTPKQAEASSNTTKDSPQPINSSAVPERQDQSVVGRNPDSNTDSAVALAYFDEGLLSENSILSDDEAANDFNHYLTQAALLQHQESEMTPQPQEASGQESIGQNSAPGATIPKFDNVRDDEVMREKAQSSRARLYHTHADIDSPAPRVETLFQRINRLGPGERLAATHGDEGGSESGHPSITTPNASVATRARAPWRRPSNVETPPSAGNVSANTPIAGSLQARRRLRLSETGAANPSESGLLSRKRLRSQQTPGDDTSGTESPAHKRPRIEPLAEEDSHTRSATRAKPRAPYVRSHKPSESFPSRTRLQAEAQEAAERKAENTKTPSPNMVAHLQDADLDRPIKQEPRKKEASMRRMPNDPESTGYIEQLTKIYNISYDNVVQCMNAAGGSDTLIKIACYARSRGQSIPRIPGLWTAEEDESLLLAHDDPRRIATVRKQGDKSVQARISYLVARLRGATSHK